MERWNGTVNSEIISGSKEWWRGRLLIDLTRLTWTVFSQMFSLFMPALFIRMSRRPNVSTVLWNASVEQKQRSVSVSEWLQRLEQHHTLSWKLGGNQKCFTVSFERRGYKSMKYYTDFQIRVTCFSMFQCFQLNARSSVIKSHTGCFSSHGFILFLTHLNLWELES